MPTPGRVAVHLRSLHTEQMCCWPPSAPAPALLLSPTEIPSSSAINTKLPHAIDRSHTDQRVIVSSTSPTMVFVYSLVALAVASFSLAYFPLGRLILQLNSWLLLIAFVWTETHRPLVEPRVAATTYCSFDGTNWTRVSAEQDVGETKPSRVRLRLVGPSPCTGLLFAQEILRRCRKDGEELPSRPIIAMWKRHAD